MSLLIFWTVELEKVKKARWDGMRVASAWERFMTANQRNRPIRKLITPHAVNDSIALHGEGRLDFTSIDFQNHNYSSACVGKQPTWGVEKNHWKEKRKTCWRFWAWRQYSRLKDWCLLSDSFQPVPNWDSFCHSEIHQHCLFLGRTIQLLSSSLSS